MYNLYHLTCTDVHGLDVLYLGIFQYQGVRGDKERMRICVGEVVIEADPGLWTLGLP